MSLTETLIEDTSDPSEPLSQLPTDEGAAVASWWPDTDHPTIADLCHGTEEQKEAALLKLFRAYQKPVLHYIHMAWQNLSRQDAEDIASRFYQESLVGPKAHFRTYNPKAMRAEGRSGRLRSYFSSILSRDLANHHRFTMALKRGGGVRHEPIDTVRPALGVEPHSERPFLSDEFDRQWARHVVEQTLTSVQAASERQQQLQDHLLQWLRYETSDETLKDIAERFGFSHNAVRLAYVRLKRRWREELRCIVVRTLADPADLDDELRYLSAILAKSPGDHGPSLIDVV